MAFLSHFRSFVLLGVLSAAVTNAQGVKDPCAVIGGKKWVDPADVRACYRSFEVDPVLKANVGATFCYPPSAYLIPSADSRGC